MKITELFNEPKIIGVVADVNQGKSNLVYYALQELQKKGKFNLYTYGLRTKIKDAIEINSEPELENIRNSLIVADEFFTLYDLDNRKAKRNIENSLRLIHHNNNILVLCGVGENFKKFLSSKLSAIIYKKITFADLINGSVVKNVAMGYKGKEKGSSILALDKDEALIYDGEHYNKVNIPYLSDFDTKKHNEQIIKNVPKNVQKAFQKMC